ncbi:DUF1983 domain-containing protein [Cronobacter malonaticus]
MEKITGKKGGGGNSRTPRESPDSLQSIATAKILLALGEGEFAGGLTDKDIFLDGTPIRSADGTLNFPDVKWEFRPGTQTQDYIPGIPSVENEITVNTQLKATQPWTRAISNTQLSAVRVRLGVPSLQRMKDNGDVVGYRVEYKIELSTDGGGYTTVLNSAFDGKTTSLYERSHRIDLPPARTGWQLRVSRTTADSTSSRIVDTTNIEAYAEIIDAKLRYPAHSYTQLGLRAGQVFWYRARLVDRIGNQSAWTGWVRGMANDNAEDYLGDITGDFLTSADGQALQQQIDTNIEAVMQNALANNATADHQWKQYGEVRADILVVKTTIADVDKALAEMSTQVQAQIGSVTAALEDKLTAVVDASGATAIHTLKAGVRINGNYYSAGMSIAVLAQAGQPVVTRVAFNADQFVLTTGSGASQFSPFAVVGGQVFMNSAFIQDGTITSAKIGAFIQSNNYVAGSTGWIISKEGNAEFNAVTVRGTIIATEGRFSMSGAGNNVVIDGAGVTVNLTNGGRIVLGSW